MEYLKDRIWEALNMIRVFTKKPGEKPNLADEEGIILRNGATVEHCCHAVHRSIKDRDLNKCQIKHIVKYTVLACMHTASL